MVGVVTSLPGYVVDPLIKETGIGPFFEIVISAWRGMSPKLNPAGLLAALEVLQISGANDVYYVGDMPAVAAAARRARIALAWAEYGYGSPPTDGQRIKLTQFSDAADL